MSADLSVHVSIDDTVWIAAEALAFFAAQVKTPRRFSDGKIFLVSPDQLAGFEARFQLALDRVSGSSMLGRVVAAELATQLINQLLPLDPDAPVPTKHVTLHVSPGMRADTQGLENGALYEYYQGRLCVALALAGRILSRQITDGPCAHDDVREFLHGSFLDSRRLPLLSDPCSWLVAVYRVAAQQCFGTGREEQLFLLNIEAFFNVLSETIVLRPYYPQHSRVVRWVRRLTPQLAEDLLYLQRLRPLTGVRERQSIVSIIGSSANGIDVGLVDTAVVIPYNASMRGTVNWSPRGNAMATRMTFSLRKKLLPLEDVHRLTELLIGQSVSEALGAAAVAQANGTAPIAAGLSSLWRSNPLEVRPSTMTIARSINAPPSIQAADAPSEIHTRKALLRQALGSIKAEARDRQSDGIVRSHAQKPIAAAALFAKTAAAGEGQDAVAVDGNEVLAAFDEEREFEKRTNEIERLLEAPLQAVRMSDQDWQQLISETVSSLRGGGGKTLKRQASPPMSNDGVHRPVPVSADVVFY